MSSPNFPYRADIDGLRAVAVLPVVFYHAGFATFSGGFVGVDVFFVISGFLITSIIAAEIDQRRFKLRDFYIRRARRLFPALFTVMFAASIAAYLLLMPTELEDFGQSVATTALFSSNFLFFTEAGYFDGPAELKPLLHTWSLAIEEQYYLLFPGFLLLIRNRLGEKFLAWTTAAFVISLLISIWSVYNAANAAFYLLPSRTWELLLGSIIALTPGLKIPSGLREVASLSGLGLILVAVFSFDAQTHFPGAAALLPCVGTALILMCGREGNSTYTMKLLELRGVVFFGLISYSLYLWHWPIFVFARHFLLTPLTAVHASVLVVVALVISIASWHFVEKPFRGSKGLLSGTGVLRASGILIVAAIVIGLWFDQSEGLPDRLPLNVKIIADVANDKPPERKLCEGISAEKISFESVCRVNKIDKPPSFVVWGDSHAMASMPAISRVSADFGVNGLNLTSNGCTPFLGVSRPHRDLRAECVAFNNASLQVIKGHPQLKTVILVSRWARHAEGTIYGNEEGENLFLATTDRVAKTPEENRQIYDAALTTTLEALHKLQVRVVIIGPIPEAGNDIPGVLAKATWRNSTVDLSIKREDFEARQRFVHQTFLDAQDRFGFGYFEPAPLFCDAQYCEVTNEAGIPLYFDDNHISSYGAARLEPLVRQVFEYISEPR